MPPINGRAGKFLEEERFLKEYPLQGPIGFLEVSIAVAFNGCIELPVEIGNASWKVACVFVYVFWEYRNINLDLIHLNLSSGPFKFLNI